MTIHEIIRRPLVTEKGVGKKETENTLCFEVAPNANKVQVKAAVERLFKVKVVDVRTCTFEGKMRRRGRFVDCLSNRCDRTVSPRYRAHQQEHEKNY